MNLCWLWPMATLSFSCFLVAPNINFSIIFSRFFNKTDRPVITRVIFLALLENWTFAKFQSTGVSLNSQYHCKKIEKGLMMISVSSLSTLGWIPLGPIDSYAFRWSSKSCTSLELSGSWSLLQSQSSSLGHLECDHSHPNVHQCSL